LLNEIIDECTDDCERSESSEYAIDVLRYKKHEKYQTKYIYAKELNKTLKYK
jgi:hypothetical protein